MTTNMQSEQTPCENGRSEERGFILVSVIVILAILTIVGAVATMKSTIEIKVSAGSVQSEQALAAANAGLAENYAFWAFDTTNIDPLVSPTDGQTEMTDVVTYVNSYSGAAPPIYIDGLAATSLAGDTPSTTLTRLVGDQDADLDKDMDDIDIYIRGTAGIRI